MSKYDASDALWCAVGLGPCFFPLIRSYKSYCYHAEPVNGLGRGVDEDGMNGVDEDEMNAIGIREKQSFHSVNFLIGEVGGDGMHVVS